MNLNNNKIQNIFNVTVLHKKMFLNIYIYFTFYNTLIKEQQYIHKAITKHLRYISF